MIRRPKPGEDDLEEMMREFEQQGGSVKQPAAKVVRVAPAARRGEDEGDGGDEGEDVNMATTAQQQKTTATSTTVGSSSNQSRTAPVPGILPMSSVKETPISSAAAKRKAHGKSAHQGASTTTSTTSNGRRKSKTGSKKEKKKASKKHQKGRSSSIHPTSPEGRFEVKLRPSIQGEALKRIHVHEGMSRNAAQSSTGSPGNQKPSTQSKKSLFAAQFDSIFGDIGVSSAVAVQQAAPEPHAQSTPTSHRRESSKRIMHDEVHPDNTTVPSQRGLMVPGMATDVLAMGAAERASALQEVKSVLGAKGFASLQSLVAKRKKARGESSTIGKETTTSHAISSDAPGAKGLGQPPTASIHSTKKPASHLHKPDGSAVTSKEAEKLPFIPDESWVNMDVVETDKLAWMMHEDDSDDDEDEDNGHPRSGVRGSPHDASAQLKPNSQEEPGTASSADEEMRQMHREQRRLAKKYNDIRFDFKGNIMRWPSSTNGSNSDGSSKEDSQGSSAKVSSTVQASENELAETVGKAENPSTPEMLPPVSSGLYHHGLQHNRPGYTLSELFEMVRSSVPSQRVVGLKTLAAILEKAKNGEYTMRMDEGPGRTQDSGTVLLVLTKMGITLFLRKAMDDPNKSVVTAAVEAMRNLLFLPTHLDMLRDMERCHPSGHVIVPLRPQFHPDENEDANTHGVDEGTKKGVGSVDDDHQDPIDPRSDKDGQRHHIAASTKDTGLAVLKMNLIPRLRYLLEVAQISACFAPCLDILAYYSRRSLESALIVADSPRLVEEVVIPMFVVCMPSRFTSAEAHRAAVACRHLALDILSTLCRVSRRFAHKISRQSMLVQVLTAAIASPLELPTMAFSGVPRTQTPSENGAKDSNDDILKKEDEVQEQDESSGSEDTGLTPHLEQLSAAASASTLDLLASLLRFNLMAHLLAECFSAAMTSLQTAISKKVYGWIVCLGSCIENGTSVAAAMDAENHALHWAQLTPLVDQYVDFAETMIKTASNQVQQQQQQQGLSLDARAAVAKAFSVMAALLAKAPPRLSSKYVPRVSQIVLLQLEMTQSRPQQDTDAECSSSNAFLMCENLFPRPSGLHTHPLSSSPSSSPSSSLVWGAVEHSLACNPVLMGKASAPTWALILHDTAWYGALMRCTKSLYALDKACLGKQLTSFLRVAVPLLLESWAVPTTRPLFHATLYRFIVEAVARTIELAVDSDSTSRIPVQPAMLLSFLCCFTPAQASLAHTFVSRALQSPWLKKGTVTQRTAGDAAMDASASELSTSIHVFDQQISQSVIRRLSGSVFTEFNIERQRRLDANKITPDIDGLMMPTLATTDKLPVRGDFVLWSLDSALTRLQECQDCTATEVSSLAAVLDSLTAMSVNVGAHITRISLARKACALLEVFVRAGDPVYRHSIVGKSIVSAVNALLLPTPTCRNNDSHDARDGALLQLEPHFGSIGEVDKLVRTFVQALEEFESASLGDQSMAYCMLACLQMRMPVVLRLQAYGSQRFIHLCAVKQVQLAQFHPTFLLPLETDRQLLDLYTTALHTLSFDQTEVEDDSRDGASSMIYRIALHHVAAFLFLDFGEDTTKSIQEWKMDEHFPLHRLHALRRCLLALPDGRLGDLLRYTSSVAAHPVIYFPLDGDVDPARLKMCRALAAKDKQVHAALKRRGLIE